MNPPISDIIWDDKYRLKTFAGVPIDQTVDDTWRRVAKALAAAELPQHQPQIEQEFYEVMSAGLFSPAGRIISGAGTGRTVTLSNCFTMGTIPDSMDGIFTALKEAALTMQQGGGIGYDFSTIRPRGAEVKGVAADASGPLPFMDTWDAMCRTIMSAGSRRGAMMATMRCDHPSIEEFIDAKKDGKRLRMFNLSVLISDAFMEAVRADSPWRLHFEDRHGVTISERVISARGLWEKIMRSTYEYAEPGVIFIDRVNRDHNLGYLETIATTNPCGEKPMGPYASCLLGSINLAKLITKAFRPDADLDLPKLTRAVKTAIRAMDNVIDVGNFPLDQQRLKAQQDRQLGLGVTGLADALIMLNLVYGSVEAQAFTADVMGTIALTAYQASIDLAKEKGSFPTFIADEFLRPERFAGRMLPFTMQAEIRAFGIRNGLLLSIAPTGTISLFAGNVSSGIEPVFAYEYKRKVLQPDGTHVVHMVEDFAIAAYRAYIEEDLAEWLDFDLDKLPAAFVSAQTLSPGAHVAMQAAAQKWVDSSISKTVNCPEDISFDDFVGVYDSAFDTGCKGCTTYRPNAVTGSILSVDAAPPPESPEVVKNAALEAAREVEAGPQERPDVLLGEVIKLRWPGSEHAIYVTISDIIDPMTGHRRPFEIFINSKSMEHYSWTVALTRMISAIFRRPHDSRFVVEELKAVFDPKGGAWVGGAYIPSVLAMIGRAIEGHMLAIGYIEPTLKASVVQSATAQTQPDVPADNGPFCEKCYSANMKNESGCLQCLDCFHSKCG